MLVKIKIQHNNESTLPLPSDISLFRNWLYQVGAQYKSSGREPKIRLWSLNCFLPLASIVPKKKRCWHDCIPFTKFFFRGKVERLNIKWPYNRGRIRYKGVASIQNNTTPQSNNSLSPSPLKTTFTKNLVEHNLTNLFLKNSWVIKINYGNWIT